MLNKNGGEESARFGVFRSDDDACLIIVAFRAYTLTPPLFGALPCSSLIWPAVLLWAESNLIPQSHPQQLPTESESFYFDEEKKIWIFFGVVVCACKNRCQKEVIYCKCKQTIWFLVFTGKKNEWTPIKKIGCQCLRLNIFPKFRTICSQF